MNADPQVKTIVLTGATSGIGREVAFQLLISGHRVIAAARDMKKAEAVASELIKNSGNENLVFMRADLADFGSVKAFAGSIITGYPTVDILINNAGTW